MMHNTSGTSASGPRAVTVGTFDGVHLGHRKVVEYLSELSAARGLTPAVITFEPHPLAVIAPERAPLLLETPEERERCLREAGAEVIVLRFDESLRRMTVKEWLGRLATEFDTRLLVAGYDNTFGSDGMTMGVREYGEIGKEYGIEVAEAPVVEGISSTNIRRALAAGDTAAAARMLGRPFSISGIVTHGRELGRRLGFPTANIQTDASLLLPAPGVYAADAVLRDGSRHRAVVNIGTAPTVSQGLPMTTEAHLTDFSGNLYDSELRLEFLRRLRDEQRFPDLDALKERIANDITDAQNI
ncbi:MAG: riboflavin biosynthesis protein RibF [Muribaculaceae bacterium]|nr:riboflavin biosynthesis protein RibF [Muribaculaceae bacterium]